MLPRCVALRRHQRQKAPRLLSRSLLGMSKPDDVLLSREIHPTIIGAEAFHGPVRDGKGWDHLAMVVRQKRTTFCSQAARSGELQKIQIGRSRPRRMARRLRSLDSQPTSRTRQHDYGIKPHGQLVPVSFRPYSPSTPGLSTSWSRTTLKGGQASGKTHLQASFPLRCFQRLSLPHVATRQCHWRDNRYTRGASTPVLSY